VVVVHRVAGDTELSVVSSLQEVVAALALGEPAVVYPAREVVTMDPMRPAARAVAVRNGRIVGVGSLEEVVAGLGGAAHVVDERFVDLVLVPGLIDQHVHPLLAALTMSLPIISMEDWVLPSGTVPAVTDEAGYRRRLAQALAEDTGSGVFYT
jgi:cytosine/adenosine deaminase-related metal-dependent hydrolase